MIYVKNINTVLSEAKRIICFEKALARRRFSLHRMYYHSEFMIQSRILVLFW